MEVELLEAQLISQRKKGKPGRQKNIMVNTGSYGTTNYSTSYSGSDDDKNFYLGFERFQTEGMSAMTHNDEKDGYKNNSLVANYSQNLSNELKFKSNLRLQIPTNSMIKK